MVAGGDGYNRWIGISGLDSTKKFPNLSDHAGGIRSLAFTSDGKTLISTARDGQIILWDTSTWERKATLMVFGIKKIIIKADKVAVRVTFRPAIQL